MADPAALAFYIVVYERIDGIVSVRRAGWCPSCIARAYFAEVGK